MIGHAFKAYRCGKAFYFKPEEYTLGLRGPCCLLQVNLLYVPGFNLFIVRNILVLLIMPIVDNMLPSPSLPFIRPGTNFYFHLRGQGGLHGIFSEIYFLVVSDRGDLYPIRCFWSNEKILSLAEVIASRRSTLQRNCIVCAIFNRSP